MSNTSIGQDHPGVTSDTGTARDKGTSAPHSNLTGIAEESTHAATPPSSPDEAPAKEHKEPGKAPVRDPTQR